MPKPYTYPILFDSCLTLSVNVFKKLKHSEIKTGNISWSKYGEKVAEIAFKVNSTEPTPSIHLKYNGNGNPISEIIQTVSVPSNIGKGNILYFICPRTSKRCRKLYLVDCHFTHREAIKGIYKKQTESKYYRALENTEWCKEINIENQLRKLHRKHFKRYYNGNPTKAYTKIQNKVEAIKSSFTTPFF